MITTHEDEIIILQEITCHLLHELQFGVHRLGYKQLLFLIPCYVLDSNQSMSKELYPYAAEYFGYISWQPIEHAVRVAITDAWKQQNSSLWEQYFPGLKKPPSNKRFIATIAERIKNTPPI